MNTRHFASVLLVSFLCAPFAAFAQCADWLIGPFDNGTAANGANGSVLASTYWDPDGDGPLQTRLVVGGTFTSIGGVAAQHIAWRDPASGQWNALGFGTSVNVYALTTWNGYLVAAGGGDSDPGSTDNNILRWDGSTWQTFYGGTSTGTVYALAVYNGQLFAGGSFVIYPTVLNAAYRIARWNEGAGKWEEVDSGCDNTVQALYPWAGYLYVGGAFAHAGGQAVDGFARWNGAWQNVGTTAVRGVTGFCPGYNGELLASGNFINGNGLSAPGAGSWNGSSWTVYPTTTANSSFFRVAAYNGSVYGAGFFTTINGSAVPHIARWSGSAWQNVDFGINGNIWNLITFNNELIALGDFSTAGSVFANSMARWNGYEWGAFGGGSTAGVLAMTTYNGRVVAGGSFHQFAGSGPSAHFIAGWTPTYGLSAFGSGMDNPVMALKSFTTGSPVNLNSELVAGGTFTTAGGVAANGIAHWIERQTVIPPPAWAPMGAGFNGTVYGIERFNSATIAAGTFTLSGATAVSNIARWNATTSAWEALGTGVNGAIYALKTFNGYLYAGGTFTTAGGVATGSLARWNGTSWNSVGVFFTGTVYALEVHNNQLVIGGLVSGGSANVFTFDGVSTFGGFGSGTNDYVRSLKSTGGRLYAGGDFTLAGGVPVNYIAYWDGSWHPVGGGGNQKFLAMTSYGGELHAGGYFTTVDSPALGSPSWARYTETGVPWFATSPTYQGVPPGATVTFNAIPAPGYPGFTIQWYKNGVPLSDGPTGHGSTVTGSHTTQLVITSADSHTDWGQYYAIVSNSCGSSQSFTATLSFEGFADAPFDGPLATAFDAIGPNPTGGVTRLSYALAHDAEVRVRVHDVAGRLVWDADLGRVAAGRHSASWDSRGENGARVRAGIYFVSLDADRERLGTRRLVVMQ